MTPPTASSAAANGLGAARLENERQNFQHQSNPKVWSITRSVSDYWRHQAVIDGDSQLSPMPCCDASSHQR
jgi:hypothetical protein